MRTSTAGAVVYVSVAQLVFVVDFLDYYMYFNTFVSSNTLFLVTVDMTVGRIYSTLKKGRLSTT